MSNNNTHQYLAITREDLHSEDCIRAFATEQEARADLANFLEILYNALWTADQQYEILSDCSDWDGTWESLIGHGDAVEEGARADLEIIRIRADEAPAELVPEVEEDEECNACGRESLDCSRNPCPAVIADREDSPSCVECGEPTTAEEMHLPRFSSDPVCPSCHALDEDDDAVARWTAGDPIALAASILAENDLPERVGGGEGPELGEHPLDAPTCAGSADGIDDGEGNGLPPLTIDGEQVQELHLLLCNAIDLQLSGIAALKSDHDDASGFIEMIEQHMGGA